MIFLKYGYIEIKGTKDNGIDEIVLCGAVAAHGSGTETDIYFTITYLIDLSADPNF